MKPILCLMGPTASGKSELALALAQRYAGELVSVDSAQVYRGLDIGSAKPTCDIQAQVPHHLIDIRDPWEVYSAADFANEATQVLMTLVDAGKMPILVGGTHLYYRALQQGLSDMPSADPTIRAQLQSDLDTQGAKAMHQQLKACDPIAAKQIHVNDPQRLLRALEVFQLTGQPISSYWQQAKPPSGFTFINVATLPKDRQWLHQRIAQRFMKMIGQGLIGEVQGLMQSEQFQEDLPAFRSVGYRQVIAYCQGRLSYEAMCEQAIVATRQLAKRQMTWCRRVSELHQLTGVLKRDVELVEGIYAQA